MAGMKYTIDIQEFVLRNAPVWLQCPDLMVGSVARFLFDMGRLYERQEFELGESGKIQTTKVSEL